MSNKNNKEKKQPWWQRMFMTAAIADNPAVMTASGHKVESDGSVSIDNHNDPGVTQLREEALPTALKAGLIGGAGLYGIATYGLPTALSWTAKNIALPMLGGEVVNETTRRFSDNKYNTFGDFVYNGSGLSQVANGTFAETPLRFISDMTNPGYLTGLYAKSLVNSGINAVDRLATAYDNLPVKIKFSPRENFRYRNIGGNNDGLNDLLESGVVRPPADDAIPPSKTILLRKTFTIPFFGHKGQMVDARSYAGKWFVGAEDVGNFYRPKRNQWGYTSREPLTVNDVTINRRIFPKMTNSPYIEWAPGKYTEYNTPLKILQKNGFFTPNTPDNGFKLYSGIPINVNRNSSNKSYEKLVEELRNEPFVIKTNTVDDVYNFRRAVNSDDRFIAGVELSDRLNKSLQFRDYIGHGVRKGPTEIDNLANVRAILKYGIDPNRNFFQAPLQRTEGGHVFGTAHGTPYYDGPFVLVSPNSNPYGFSHVFINDSFENELGADLARRYKELLQKEFPNIKILLYNEIK